MKIPGIPEGVEVLRYGVPAPGEFAIEYGTIHQQADPDNACQPTSRRMDKGLVVGPADGWEFIYDPMHATFRPVERFASPQRYNVEFRFTNAEQELILDRLKNVPGFVSAVPLP